MLQPTRYKLVIAYNGGSWSGFQAQLKDATIQSVLEDNLKKLMGGESCRVVPSGRTDAGVHAFRQTIHLDVRSEKGILRLDGEDFLYRFNCILPKEIAAMSITRAAPKFHARNSATGKTYSYLILQSRHANPFLENLSWRISQPLDVAAMKRATKFLIGKHDFTSFCAADSTTTDRVRTISRITFSRRHPSSFFALPNEQAIIITFTGNGFLKQMVRNIVGTLVDIGTGKKTVKDIKAILAAKDRRKAGPAAPGRGLYLKSVTYHG